MSATDLESLAKLKTAGKLHFWRGTIEMPERELHEICDEIQAEHDRAIAATLPRAVDKGKPQGADGHLDQPQVDWLRLMPDGWDPSRRVVVVDSDDYLVPLDRIAFETDETGRADKVRLDGTWYYPEDSELGRGTCKMDVLVTGEQVHYDCQECIMHCNGCGHEFGHVLYNEDGDVWMSDPPRFCPNCGRKVKQ